MIHEQIVLSDDGSAMLEVYALDPDISYGVKRKWPGVVICPGGGYVISATKEGEAVAMQFLSQGYSCFVLRYSTFLKDREGLTNGKPEINEKAYYPTQVLQLMTVMHLIHQHAKDWSIDTDEIFTVGFSAGGHITGTHSVAWNDPAFTSQLPFTPELDELKPAGCIMGYPMLTGDIRSSKKIEDNGIPDIQCDLMEKCLYHHKNPTELEINQMNLGKLVTCETPPMFIWHTVDDKITDSKITTDFIKKLQEQNIPCEYHLFCSGQHGLACANKHYAKNKSDVSKAIELWLLLVFNWLEGIKERKES